MKRKFISVVLTASMLAANTAVPVLSTSAAEVKIPQYQETSRLMEELGRGLIAAYREKDDRTVLANEKGVYLSWRLLGTESLTDQAFDIYRSTSETGTFTKIKTTGAHDATNYIDTSGTMSNYYKVVKAGATAKEVAAEKAVKPYDNHTAKGSEVGNGNSEKNSFTYVDIPVSRPDPIARVGDGKTSYYYNYDSSHQGGVNDASVGDLDCDGEYEIVLKWDPTDSKDSAGADFTGRVYIDGYEIDPNNTGYMWRIDLGPNITAGAHYTQYIVYDFDGDGKSEIAMATAPGSVDGQGHYVSEVGDTAAIRNVDNTSINVGTSGSTKGRNMGPEYYTIFDGETGAALYTTAAIPLGTSSEWGDSKYNRASRFLAGVAYLDGVHPSYIACRGYYDKAVIRAYSWDGSDMVLQWEHNASSKSSSNMYGQGNHNLSIADVDNDGFDEIVYGSAVLDHDGSKAIGNTGLGHGDALHVNDFNNDGIQEVFSVKEDSVGYKNNAADFRVAGTGKNIWGKGASGDTGRGVMDNIEDEYAKANPQTGLALAWSSSHDNTFDLKGNEVAAKPSAGSRSMCNFLLYWDGDLGREMMDDTIIGKYHIETDDAGNVTSAYTRRFYSGDGYSLTGSSSNNFTKYTPCLSADIWGDWREEVIMGVNKADNTQPAYLRIFTSTLPTEYRLTTLMHDAQYRCAVAWQNVGYNQPPHTSYYIGSAALATDGTNALNYLAPAVKYTSVTYSVGTTPVTGISLSDSAISVERTKTATVRAIIEPSDASKKSVTWTSEDPSIATVVNGIVTGVKDGKTKITATTKDGGFTASCDVTVYTNYVTGITLSDTTLDVGEGYSKTLTAIVLPTDATNKTVKWSSSNTSIVTVDANGVVTGKAGGTAVVTAETEDGGYKAECQVRVYPFIITDDTGDNVFTSSGDATGTTIKTTANSASITHSDAAAGAEVSKTFNSYTDNRASISFKFVTGGQRYDDTSWNWTGHEYTTKLKLIDAEGNNILTLAQSYGDGSNGGAGKLTATMFDKAAENVESTWAVDGIGNIQGSAKRWIVNVEFDYDNDVCSVSIKGCDSSWAETGSAVCTPFALNGASFAKLQLVTEADGTGTIKAAPTLSELVYQRIALNSSGEHPTPAPTAAPTEKPTPAPIEVVNTTTDFTAKERMTVSVDEDVITFTAASNANNKYGTAYCDLSKYISGHDKYVIEYDSYLPSSSRARVALCDTSQRPADSNKNGYITTGVAFVQGVLDDKSYAVNEDKSTYGIPAARDQYVHTKLTVDAKSKTIDFVITDSNGEMMKSASGLSYLDTELEAPNGIEMLNTINNDVTYMKNIKVTTYEYPTEAPTPSELYAEDGIVIIAEYEEDGTLKSININNVSTGTPVVKPSKENEKVFAWDSLEHMRPIAITTDTVDSAQ